MCPNDAKAPEGQFEAVPLGDGLQNKLSAEPPKNVAFSFHHKVFEIPGAVFRLDRISGSVALHINMGGISAAIDLKQITGTFDIDPESDDGHLLKTVEQSLHFVQEIRPGDSIPSEILDGTASWSIEPRHFESARSKLIVQLVRWMTDGSSILDPSADVLKLIEAPEVKSRINEAFGAAARQLGLREVDTETVIAMISQLAHELAYIEALREKIAGYVLIRRKLKDLGQIYRNDRRIAESIERIVALVSVPFSALRENFQLIDAQTAEVLSSLRQLAGTIKFVRQVRDELRAFILIWNDLDEVWRSVAIRRDGATENLVARLYHFVASYYCIGQRWTLTAA